MMCFLYLLLTMQHIWHINGVRIRTPYIYHICCMVKSKWPHWKLCRHVGFHNDNIRCHQWWQSWHHDDWQFSNVSRQGKSNARMPVRNGWLNRRYIQILLIKNIILNESGPYAFHWQLIGIGSGNGLVPNRWWAIARGSDYSVQKRHTGITWQ